jgi:hypothetical protein
MTRRSQSGKYSRDVSEVLSDRGGSFGSVLNRASRLMRVQKLLLRFVDPELRGQVRVAAIKQGRLVLLTPSAAWATRLRMQAPRLIESLRGAGLAEIRNITVKVAPLPGQPAADRRRKPLSPAAEQAFQLMGRLTADEED